MQHIVMYSGGAGSWAAAKSVVEAHGTADCTLLFTDTKIEDDDCYRFLKESSAQLGAPVTLISEGRDPWQVFNDERYIGNTRADPCSKVLKRQMARRWLEQRYASDQAIVYVGFDWTEEHRAKRSWRYWKPYKTLAPLCDPPFLSKGAILDMMEGCGLKPPRLYAMGFPHNNCGGFCVKAGISQFRLLYETFPDRYLEHERKEEALRAKLGKDVSILRDQSGGKTTPLTMRELRRRIDEGCKTPRFEWGGCGCFSD